jgi:hypothetical protein
LGNIGKQVANQAPDWRTMPIDRTTAAQLAALQPAAVIGTNGRPQGARCVMRSALNHVDPDSSGKQSCSGVGCVIKALRRKVVVKYKILPILTSAMLWWCFVVSSRL